MSSAPINPNPTPAQEEFQQLLNNSVDKGPRVHPEDVEEARGDESDQDEEDEYRSAQIDAAMRMPSVRDTNLRGNLPPASFDSGRSTGVKGVIADARAYEQARQDRWSGRIRAARKSVFGGGAAQTSKSASSDEEGLDEDDERFIQEWRDSRKMQLEQEAMQNAVRTRRTSPSLRMFGRLDTVDALGYLDAIEKVGRDTTVVVFVYDHECEVSAMIESAMRPLVIARQEIHFVKVHYEDIEFDNAAVPTLLAYRNQGDLFANLTGIIDMIPEDEDFGTAALRKVLEKHDVL